MRRVLLVLGSFLALAAPAGAASRIDIYRDCEPDGKLQGAYTPAEIRDARQNIPSDLAEYSDCIDALRRAELSGTEGNTPVTPEGPDGSAGSGAGGGGTGTGTSATPEPELVPETPEDHNALAGAIDGPDQPLSVTGVDGADELSPLRDGYEANPLPGPLAVALVLLALAGLALCLPPLRRRALPLLSRR